MARERLLVRGELVQRERILQGLSVAALAKKAGISAQAIHDLIENEHAGIAVTSAVAKALDLKMEDIVVFGDSKPEQRPARATA